MANEYGRLVEEWKVELIERRARRKGFRPDELDDVLQDVVPVVAVLRFELERSNGATETTAITAVIDHQLAFIRRGLARRRKYQAKYLASRGLRDGRVTEEPHIESEEPRLALAHDVRQAMRRLTSRERIVCSRLSLGEPRSTIARTMGLSRYGVDRLVDGIQAQFQAWGLNGWIQG